ncbi:MAG: response regulator [Desulfovibrionaceae bacterium]|nr:response regulator [Desulfovibrionaceae bacterium]
MRQILLVDEQSFSRMEICEYLEGRHMVIMAETGGQALEKALRQPLDLILLEVRLPDMDGFELLSRLRKIPALAWVPVIFLTGCGDEETEVMALESGAADFIVKPVEEDVLLHRIGLHLQITQYQRDIERVLASLEDSIIISFADLIETRGKNINNHDRKVGQLMRILCHELLDAGEFAGELDEERIRDMVRAAPLHDIGKIGISDTILLKPGKLSPEEFAIVKEHTAIGGRVLRRLHEHNKFQEHLLCAAVMAENHHERYDGQGYPHGLRGEDIPLSARIMAVVNVYASLISDSVFRLALSHDEACARIMAGRETEFDPRVLDAFERVVDEIRILP